jgi:diguanylate cyclase (GGDEF)-like protein
MTDGSNQSTRADVAEDIEADDPPTMVDRVAPEHDHGREDLVFVVISGPDAGSRFVVPREGGVLGREVGVDMQLSDVNVSRRHAAVLFDGQSRVIISDLGSSNGVFVNGVQVSRGEVLDGYRVQLSADTVLRARFQDPRETRMQDDLAGAQTRDALTGLPNRRDLLDRLAQELSFARRHQEPLSIVLADVDGMQKVIDTDGHRGASMLLSAIAELIREGSRYEDIVGRYGEDEVLVVLRATVSERALSYAERMAAVVRKRAFDVGDVAIRATVSLGVAAYEPGRFDIDGALLLVERAETAVQRAKQQGKDRAAAWKLAGDCG